MVFGDGKKGLCLRHDDPGGWNGPILLTAGCVIGAVVGASYAVGGKAVADFLLHGDSRLQWEVLLTGVAAIVGARWAIRGIRDQIAQADRHEDDRRRRRERAARATLPLRLAECSDYAKTCIHIFANILNHFPEGGDVDRVGLETTLLQWAPPTVPQSLIPIVKECIEFADDSAASAMSNLLMRLQIQNSRMLAEWGRVHPATVTINGQHGVAEALIDAAEIAALVAELFPYSRGVGQPNHTINARHIRMAIVNADIPCLGFLSSKVGQWRSQDLR